jgi:curved DNA-binding protein CbpA
VNLMAEREDYYQVLGVPRQASTREIRRAYRRLARQHHPDRNPQPDGPQRFRSIAEAYSVLGDPARRTHYDHRTRPVVRRGAPDIPPAVPSRRGVLELSRREARIAASSPITLAATDGSVVVLPAGVLDGDQLMLRVPGGWAALTVRIRET